MNKAAKELWWEERDLHVIYADGSHVIFRNAWFKEMKCDSVEQDETDPNLFHISAILNVTGGVLK